MNMIGRASSSAAGSGGPGSVVVSGGGSVMATPKLSRCPSNAGCPSSSAGSAATSRAPTAPNTPRLDHHHLRSAEQAKAAAMKKRQQLDSGVA